MLLNKLLNRGYLPYSKEVYQYLKYESRCCRYVTREGLESVSLDRKLMSTPTLAAVPANRPRGQKVHTTVRFHIHIAEKLLLAAALRRSLLSLLKLYRSLKKQSRNVAIRILKAEEHCGHMNIHRSKKCLNYIG